MNRLAQRRKLLDHQFRPFSDEFWKLHKMRAEVNAPIYDLIVGAKNR